MRRKVLVSHAWADSDVPHLQDFIRELESHDCEVVLYDSPAAMTEADLKKWLPGFYGHICGGVKYTAEVMDALPELKIISRIGVGFETVDIPAATARGIAVATTPGAGAETVSEHAFTMLAALSRRVFPNDRMVRSGGWTTVTGRSFYRKTLGIVGFGLIGRQLARWAQGFQMHVVAYDPYPDEAYAQANGVRYLPLDELLRVSDYVSLHLPLMDSTRNLIGERELGLMKPTASLINAARGGIVNEEALYRALRDGVIESAALDVFTSEPIEPDNPLLSLENVIFSPHMAGSTFEGLDAIEGMAFRNVAEFADGGVPAGIRNPEVLGN